MPEVLLRNSSSTDTFSKLIVSTVTKCYSPKVVCLLLDPDKGVFGVDAVEEANLLLAVMSMLPRSLPLLVIIGLL